MTEPNVSYGDQRVAMAGEILCTEVGSTVHGIATGSDDLDLMAIYIEPREWVYGVIPETNDPNANPGMPHFISRSKPEGQRSGPGDVDMVAYSLRKFLRLAIKGHPTVLLPLFAPEDKVLRAHRLGRELREMRTAFLSQDAVERFLGYMREQHLRMMGGGKQNRVPNRPELIEKYGFDVKFAAHALRLAMQGWEVASTGYLSLPMQNDDRQVVLSVKRGEISRDAVSAMIAALELRILELLAAGKCQLPVHPYLPVINKWSMEAHESRWFHGRRS